MSETPETDAAILQILIERGVVDHRNAPECLVDKCRKLERERNEAIRILRVLKSDIDHMGHWLPDPCRKMVETFLSEEGGRHE